MILNRRDFLLGGAACGLCASAGNAHAQSLPTRLDFSGMRICSASPYPTWDGTVDVRPASAHAEQVVRWMTHTMGVDGNFTLLQAKIDRWAGFASLHTRHQGRFIVIDERHLNWGRENPDWAAIGLLGHEIGHHLNGDTNLRSPHGRGKWDRELHADQTAGFLMARLGATLDEALTRPRGYRSEGSETHPPRDRRMAAYERGWRRADALKAWEEPACETGWLGEPFEVGGETCRIARQCTADEVPILACRNPLGDWIIKR